MKFLLPLLAAYVVFAAYASFKGSAPPAAVTAAAPAGGINR